MEKLNTIMEFIGDQKAEELSKKYKIQIWCISINSIQ